jgi:hypothetical protein
MTDFFFHRALTMKKNDAIWKKRLKKGSRRVHGVHEKGSRKRVHEVHVNFESNLHESNLKSVNLTTPYPYP